MKLELLIKLTHILKYIYSCIKKEKFNEKNFVLLVLLTFFIPYTAQSDFLSEEDRTVNVGESLLQSTVIITTLDVGGSGFYISPYEIITSHHVVNELKTVLIKKSNGSLCFGDVVFSQSTPDLAFIKTKCEGKPLTIATGVKVGQTILTMGQPLLQEFFISKGIVGLLKKGEILHDALIDKGSSGGPVVNLNGQLVGVSQAFAKEMPRMSVAIDVQALSYFMYQAKENG